MKEALIHAQDAANWRRKGKEVPKPVRVALRTSDWDESDLQIAKLKIEGLPKPEDRSVASVRVIGDTAIEAADEWMTENKRCQQLFLDGHLDNDDHIRPSTCSNYDAFIRLRFKPWCQKENITDIKEFEKPFVCKKFVNSWKKFNSRTRKEKCDKDGKKEELASISIQTYTGVFWIFLRWCLRQELITREGLQTCGKKRGHLQKQVIVRDGEPNSDITNPAYRYGLEHNEFERLLATDDPSLTPGQNAEIRAACLLGRNVGGMRECDMVRFTSAKIINGGTHAHYEQWKLRPGAEHKIMTTPIPAGRGILESLAALPKAQNAQPGETICYFEEWGKGLSDCGKGNKLSAAIKRRGEIAQKIYGEFAHPPFKPHRLRHTFAIHLRNAGMSFQQIGDLMGDNEQTVSKHYTKRIKSTNAITEAKFHETMNAQLAEIAPLQAEANAKREEINAKREEMRKINQVVEDCRQIFQTPEQRKYERRLGQKRRANERSRAKKKAAKLAAVVAVPNVATVGKRR